MSDGLVFVIPDLQVPLHDKAFVGAMAQCITDNRKRIDRVVTVGDELDMTEIGRWSEGTPAAYTRQLGAARDEWVQVAKDLSVTDALRSNHTDRLYNAVMRKIPGLLGVPELEIENFMRLPELGIRFHPKGLRLRDWHILHGDESGLSGVAGTTARNLVQKVGTHVAIGHTHRAGIVPHTTSLNGKVTRTLFGVEVGHAMAYSRVTYARTMNWQQAWLCLQPTSRSYSPMLMPVVDRSFYFDGKKYTW